MDHTFNAAPGFSRLSPSAQCLAKAILEQPALYHGEHTVSLPETGQGPSSYFSGFQEAIDFLRVHSIPCSFFDLCRIELTSDGRATQLNLKSSVPYHRRQVVNAITEELLVLTGGLSRDQSQTSQFYRLYQRVTGRYAYQDHPLGHSIYGLVSEKAGVCQAVAGMICLCCSVLGIESDIVRSRDHCWNLVTLDGCTAHFDCTWDLGETPLTGFKHYGLSSDEIERLPDHQAVDGMHAVHESARLNWYVRKSLVCTPSAGVSAIRRQFKHNGVATCRFPGLSRAEIEQLLHTALEGTASGSCSYSIDALNTVTVQSLSSIPR